MEAPDDLDESWSHGALIGGMVSCGTDDLVARSYWEAAEVLVDLGIRDDEMWRYAMPAAFLYRHALELVLKQIVGYKKTHKLGPMVEELEKLLAIRAKRLPLWARNAILEFERFDSRGTTFRYADQAFVEFGGEEHWIDFAQMKRVMRPIMEGLERLAKAGS